ELRCVLICGKICSMPGEETHDDHNIIIKSVPGLADSLCRYISLWNRDEPIPLSQNDIADKMADDPDVEAAVLAFLSNGGEGYDYDRELANNLREELLRALVVQLRQRLNRKGNGQAPASVIQHGTRGAMSELM